MSIIFQSSTALLYCIQAEVLFVTDAGVLLVFI